MIQMIQKIKQFVIVGLVGFAMVMPGLLVPVASGVASADIKTDLCNGADKAAGTATTCTQTNGTGSTGVEQIARDVTTIFSEIVGAISIIMIIYAGFRYITSGGDSGKVGNAKTTLIYALVGLVIVVLAQLIVRFVLTQAGNVTNGI
jgi:hypothetical protein